MNRTDWISDRRARRYKRIAHLLVHACDYCKAPAGEPCRSKAGEIWSVCQMHNARLSPNGGRWVRFGRIKR